MNFDDPPEDRAFRAELRAWLRENDPGAPPGDPEEAFDHRCAWQRRMADAGWAAPGWPVGWGGRDASVAQQIIFQEELALGGLPTIANAIAVWNIGPALLEHGSEEQKRRWLPPMLAADEIWCQGFSEPNAGSDLANVQARAERRGDDYVVNGQKVWISYGHRADRCFLLCRTGAPDSRQRGLSVLVVDMRARGVEPRPLRDIAGGAGFSEVFFNDVAVPATDRVGEEHGGWRVAMSTLMHERVGTVTYGIQLRQKLEAFLRTPEAWPSDPVARRLRGQEIAALWIEVEIIRLTALRAVTKAARGQDTWPEVPIGKLLWSTVSQDLAETAARALGPDGLLGETARDVVWSRMTTIGAGTTEIQKNILAERALGLPRG